MMMLYTAHPSRLKEVAEQFVISIAVSVFVCVGAESFRGGKVEQIMRHFKLIFLITKYVKALKAG